MTLTHPKYRPRLIDDELKAYLDIFGAVCIEGPKWCGKTWTALNQANSALFIGDRSNNFQNKKIAENSTEVALAGDRPRLLDEWQEVPSLWDAVRFDVDMAEERGRFILTGSSTPNRKGVLHSGAGRIGTLRMHTMSLFESGDSSGKVSLRGLFDSVFAPCETGEASLKHLIDLTVRGGWPSCMEQGAESANVLLRSYLNAVVDADVSSIDGIRRDSRKMRMLIKSIARNESTVASRETLRRDMMEYDKEGISHVTAAEYMDVLRRLFILEEQPAFNPNLRSSVNVGKSPKLHLADPALSIAALEATPEKLLNDLRTYGLMFEAMCERDLRVYAQSNRGKLSHYRDSAGREIDAIVEMPDGRWGAFEIKLGTNEIDGAATKLIKMKDIIESEPNVKPPAVLGVICGLSSYAYRRDDGVYVIPILALRD